RSWRPAISPPAVGERASVGFASSRPGNADNGAGGPPVPPSLSAGSGHRLPRRSGLPEGAWHVDATEGLAKERRVGRTVTCARFGGAALFSVPPLRQGPLPEGLRSLPVVGRYGSGAGSPRLPCGRPPELSGAGHPNLAGEMDRPVSAGPA